MEEFPVDNVNLLEADQLQDVVCLYNVHVARGLCSQESSCVAKISVGTHFFPTLPSMLALLEPTVSGLHPKRFVQLAKIYRSCAVLWPDGTVVLFETSSVHYKPQHPNEVCNVLAIIPPTLQDSQTIGSILQLLARDVRHSDFQVSLINRARLDGLCSTGHSKA